MSCTNPLYARYAGPISEDTGKRPIQLLRKTLSIEDYRKIYGDDFLLLPCGKCDSCIEERSKAWALRCVLEACYHDYNSFITLTYNEKSMPKGLCKKDVQKFFKRLRKLHPDFNIRYYGCGEYGPSTHRPHYHFIVFGYMPSDARFVKFSKYGGCFYTSEELQKLWPFGFVSIGDVSFSSCCYVARYCQKKLGNYNEWTKKEFSMMSLKPGIGAQYFLDHQDLIKKYDHFYGDFGTTKEIKSCRYFDKLLERCDKEEFEKLKFLRIEKGKLSQINDMLVHGLQREEDLFNYRAEIKHSKFDRLKRKEL